LEAQAELFSRLQRQVSQIAPYITNYPTLRPADGRVTSGFGTRGGRHRGIDIANSFGTPIVATGGGIVTFSGWSGGYGNKVIIDHGLGIQTLYAHNTSNLVQVGQRVSRGDIIARMGSTGNSTGSHVHYEVHVNGRTVNPVGFFLEPA
jgi:murein DD-endopeptidase MepM/ murein hydrolase activator NlpD